MELLILSASSSPELLDRCEQSLRGFATVVAATRLVEVDDYLARALPHVLLLDMDLQDVNGAPGVVRLRKLSPTSKIIALSGSITDDFELSLFKAGVRGCAHVDIDGQLLKRVVVAVQQGELWIRRRITLRLLDELSENARGRVEHRRMTDTRLAVLTQREREIAALIGNGETNKQIARQLSITERTVKAHLTEIFRKLGIGDRLRLALRMTGSAQPDTHNSA